MSKCSTSADDFEIVSPDRVRSVMQGVLRAAQASGWTDQALEQASGVKARAIKSYRVEGKELPLSSALSLAVVLGPRALNPLLALIGYVATPLDEPDAANPVHAMASAMQHFAVFAEAAKDGRIDHIEKPDCTEAADMIIAEMIPFSSAAGAA